MHDNKLQEYEVLDLTINMGKSEYMIRIITKLQEEYEVLDLTTNVGKSQYMIEINKMSVLY